MRKLSSFASALFIAAIASRVFAITVTPPPTKEMVAQEWVGFSVDDSETLLLDLKPNGAGSGVLLTNDVAAHFHVTAWNLSSTKLEVDIQFDKDGDRAHFTGQFKSYLSSYNTTILPHPERVYDGQLPGPLELSCKELRLRIGLWPQQELQHRLDRARAEMQPAPN